MTNEPTNRLVTALAEGTELAQVIEIEPDHVQPLREYCHRNRLASPLASAHEGSAVLLVVSQVDPRLRVHLRAEPEELGLLCVLATPEQLDHARRFLTHPRYRSTLWHLSQTTRLSGACPAACRLRGRRPDSHLHGRPEDHIPHASLIII